MASKGQKFKRYPLETKEEILEKYSEGRGYKSIARDYPNIPVHTIQTWLRQTKAGIDIRIRHNKGKSGRLKEKKLTLEDYKERYEILKKYRAFLQARREKK